MDPALDEQELRAEVERLMRRYRHLVAGTHRAPCSWVLEERTLRWHIVVGDALEPDIDVEQLPDVLVVRAQVGREVHEALIPVPDPFRGAAPRCVLRSQLFEIRFAL
jgi:hypothetical protein